MNPWSKIRSLLRRRNFDADMSEEMRLHLERRSEENRAKGMSPEEARYAARRKFGGVEQIKERVREQRGWAWWDHAVQDVRYALRQFARAKGFTAVVVLTLALGIGSITAIYSVVDGVILNPVPGPASDRLVQIGRWVHYPNRPAPNRAGLIPPVVEALATQRDFFAEFTWSDFISLERTGEDFATTASGSMVPPDFFTVLGVRPQVGRTFSADEAVIVESRQPVGDTTLVIAHRWWQAEFGGDPNVLGRVVEMGGRRFTIVGVMPDYFQYPGGDFWLPVQPPRLRPNTMTAGNIKLIARLQPGVTLARTQAMLDTVVKRLFADYPPAEVPLLEFSLRAGPSGRLWVMPLHDALQDASFGSGYQDVRRTLFGLLAAIAFVLAIVCANVANLSLARTERRQHELAIRAALGAGRSRLLRQLLTENLLLALWGGAAGLLVTGWGIKLLVAFNTLPRLRPIEVDGRVLVMALAASVLTGLAFGLVPAWRAGRTRLNEMLTQSGLGATPGARGTRYRNALVIVEVALAVVLLTGAGLMVQSVLKLLRVDPGLDASKLITVHLQLVGRSTPRTIETRNELVGRVRERLAMVPGVSAAGILKDEFNPERVLLEGTVDPVLLIRAHVGWGSSDFFRAARISLLQGRFFEQSDVGENAGTVIVNETLARLCWPGENAVGKRFRAVQKRGAPAYEVVGVVSDARVYRFDEPSRPLFYRPYPEAQIAGAPETLVARTLLEPERMVTTIREALKGESQHMRTPMISVIEQALYESTRGQRTYRNYLVTFALAGLLLAALGIYGVLAYAVALRTREIGIRIAVGAERRHVIGMVMGEGIRLIAAGILLGMMAAFWLVRLLQNKLYEVGAHDPWVAAAVVLLLMIAGLVACWLPAHRAARVDPLVALRAE